MLRHSCGQYLLQCRVAFLEARALVLALAEKGLKRGLEPYGLVHLGIAALAVGAEPDHLLHVAEGGHMAPRRLDECGFLGTVAARHGARHRAQHIDRREAAALGDPPLEHDMPVEDAAD